MARLGRRIDGNWRLWLGSASMVVLAVWTLWSSLDMSSTSWRLSVWVATDNIAYFGWGAIAGACAPLMVLAAAVSARQAPRALARPATVFRLRDRPLMMFLVGLAVGTILYSLFVVAALVASDTRVPWPIPWGIGFGTAIVGWIPIFYASFLGYFHAQTPAQPTGM
ncbi:MAG TPA: hypothetical protein VGR51_10510 [Thermoplasmata archaeon]|nr:hypothetical protein [Thermoplasmata archaeon]